MSRKNGRRRVGSQDRKRGRRIDVVEETMNGGELVGWIKKEEGG